MKQPEGLRKKVFAYVKEKYQAQPEYLWKRFPDYAVFRHEDNRKWFAAVMDVSAGRLGLRGDEILDILNVKLDDLFYRDMLLRQKGYFPAYHISSGSSWISVLLDGTVPFQEICGLIDLSYEVTASKKKKQQMRPPKQWIIPANPKFYDVQGAFERSREIDWKQGNGIRAGDTVYMYVAAPVSAILYCCEVLETDIPYHFEDQNLTITALMKIRLLRQYPPEQFTFEVLKKDYGIYAVRGPRGVPNSLQKDLER